MHFEKRQLRESRCAATGASTREGTVPAKHVRLEEPERRLADRLMSIAESRSVRALGVACCSAIRELTGSPTVGLYLLEGAEPDLAYSRHVEGGFLDNCKSGFWKCDPVLECILAEGRCAAPHFSCIGADKASIREKLAQFKAAGIDRLVALRGDLPSGYGGFGEFRYASELVEFVRVETGGYFRIEVAAYPEMHPQARSPEADLKAFAAKVHAGADSAITQMIFNADAYFRFVDEARGEHGAAFQLVFVVGVGKGHGGFYGAAQGRSPAFRPMSGVVNLNLRAKAYMAYRPRSWAG